MARRQLGALGFSDREIDHRARSGLLFRRHRGVFVVGGGPFSRETRWMAAVLAGGAAAALIDRSAAALWGVHHEGRRIEVCTPTQRRDREGVTFRCRRLPADEVSEQDGIPVTTISRTLLDLAATLRPRELERALNEAEAKRLTDTLTLDDLLRRHPRRPGSRAIRALLDVRANGERILRSELELRFLEFVDSLGLPAPETNVWVEGLEVDCLWRAPRVAVELDGRAFHDTADAFERDRERDRMLLAADWKPLRVTWRHLRDTPAALARDLERLLAAGTLAS